MHIFIVDFLHEGIMNININRHGYLCNKKTTMVLTCIKSQTVKIKFLPSPGKRLKNQLFSYNSTLNRRLFKDNFVRILKTN